MITRADYDRLARGGYNRIPLHRQVLADLETPVSAYLKMAQGPYSYLFESVQGGREMGPLLNHRAAVLDRGSD